MTYTKLHQRIKVAENKKEFIKDLIYIIVGVPVAFTGLLALLVIMVMVK